MKKMIFLIPVLIAIAWSQAAKKYYTGTEEFDETTEKKAIMKTIENEIDCFYKRDYDCWKENFIREEYAFMARNNRDGTFDVKAGWQEIDKKAGIYIQKNPVEPGKGSPPWKERKNIIAKFFSESQAYLTWDQYNSDEDNRTFLLSKEQRIMEKINGTWKIVNATSYWDYKNIIPADSIYNL